MYAHIFPSGIASVYFFPILVVGLLEYTITWTEFALGISLYSHGTTDLLLRNLGQKLMSSM